MSQMWWWATVLLLFVACAMNPEVKQALLLSALLGLFFSLAYYGLAVGSGASHREAMGVATAAGLAPIALLLSALALGRLPPVRHLIERHQRNPAWTHGNRVVPKRLHTESPVRGAYAKNRIGAPNTLSLPIAVVLAVAFLLAVIFSWALAAAAVVIVVAISFIAGISRRSAVRDARITVTEGVVRQFDQSGRELARIDLNQPWSLRYLDRGSLAATFRLEQQGERIDFSSHTSEGENSSATHPKFARNDSHFCIFLRS